jgi:hypothetical protein
MDRHGLTPDQNPVAAPEGETAVTPAPSARMTIPKYLWAYGLIAGLIAGTAAWACGEATYGLYKPSAKAASEPYAFKQLNLEKDHADGLNAAIAFGALGAATGLALGLLGGWARKSMRGAILGGIAGIVLAGLAGAATSPPVVPLFRKYYEPQAPDLKLPILVHGAIWCALGTAAGLAFGIGLGDRRHVIPAAIGGLIGAALATFLFDALGAMFFPFSQADLPNAPTSLPRFLARIIVASGVSLGTIWAVRPGGRGVRKEMAVGQGHRP